MPIRELRILPPFAIARLGASPTPLAAFSLELPKGNPLGFREIIPQATLEINSVTGEVESANAPSNIIFRDGADIRPVAPFLEVWAVTDDQNMVPLTLELLASEGFGLDDIAWSVEVANHKIYRRTGKEDDCIAASILNIKDHQLHPLLGCCKNFLPDKNVPLGSVRFIKPSKDHPEIRLRFTPAAGLVYGASKDRKISKTDCIPDPVLTPDRILYDETKGWLGYREPSPDFDNSAYTNPSQIFAGYDDATDNNARVSWGYFDDTCDGSVMVSLKQKDGLQPLTARALISSGPPTFVPDALPIRTVADELLQIVFGPEVKADEEVPIQEAVEIVRRALDTVRQLNTAVMNGNPINGRLRVASTMIAQDSNDFGRQFAPIMAISLADQAAVRALHERVLTALSSGSAPWFAEVLRKPEEIGDLSNKGRRKMPAMMRGADGRMLCLTRRQISQIINAASSALFKGIPPTNPHV